MQEYYSATDIPGNSLQINTCFLVELIPDSLPTGHGPDGNPIPVMARKAEQTHTGF